MGWIRQIELYSIDFHLFYLQLTTLTTTTAAYYHRGIGNDLKAVIRTMKM